MSEPVAGPDSEASPERRPRSAVRPVIIAVVVTFLVTNALIALIDWTNTNSKAVTAAEAKTEALLKGIASGRIGADDVAGMTAYAGDTAADYAKSIPALRDKLNASNWQVVSSGYGGGDGTVYVTILFYQGDSGGGSDTDTVLWSDGLWDEQQLIGSDVLGDAW